MLVILLLETMMREIRGRIFFTLGGMMQSRRGLSSWRSGIVRIGETRQIQPNRSTEGQSLQRRDANLGYRTTSVSTKLDRKASAAVPTTGVIVLGIGPGYLFWSQDYFRLSRLGFLVFFRFLDCILNILIRFQLYITILSFLGLLF